MEQVRIGVIGCGGIAFGKHLPAQKNNPDSRLVAFCDLIEERALRAKEEYGDAEAKTFTDYRDLLNEANVDAVLVLTPNCSHAEITVAALSAGKHVLCEKPMAITYKDAKAMIAARDKSGKILTVGYQNRFRPDALYLKRLVDEGTFGEIYYSEATALRRREVPTWGVFIDKEKQGGGPLIDIGTHALDLTLFMMQNYEPAYCVGKTFHKLNGQTETGNAHGDWDVEKFTAEDSAFGFVVMQNGAVINLRTSWALNYADPEEAVTLICGEKAGADMKKGLRINTVLAGKKVMITPDLTRGGVDFFEGNAAGSPSDLEARVFTNAILGKGSLYVTAEEAATVTRILEAVYTSDQTGKPYYFDESEK